MKRGVELMSYLKFSLQMLFLRVLMIFAVMITLFLTGKRWEVLRQVTTDEDFAGFDCSGNICSET